MSRDAARSSKYQDISAMIHIDSVPSTAAWTAAEVADDTRWIFHLTADERESLLASVRKGRVPGKPLIAYRRHDFPLQVPLDTLYRALAEVRDGTGTALVKGLPREGISPDEFELVTWVIGLHFDVARPQNKASAYMNRVRDMGGVYRNPGGRGYSSNAELDFHIDGADLVLLSCYNQAPEGGMSMCTSSTQVFEVMRNERPDLLRELMAEYPFSRNGEQAEDLEPWYAAPIFGIMEGRVFCTWNRNRVENALKLPGVPDLTPSQREAIEYLDAVVRRPDLMYCMHLEPGDVQILSNHTALHSRTSFVDHPDEGRKRTLYRLWLATPDSPRLPPGWEKFNGTREPGTTRGGILGQHYDDACRVFDAEQSAAMDMRLI